MRNHAASLARPVQEKRPSGGTRAPRYARTSCRRASAHAWQPIRTPSGQFRWKTIGTGPELQGEDAL